MFKSTELIALAIVLASCVACCGNAATDSDGDDFRFECKPKPGCNLGSCIDVPFVLTQLDGFDENYYRKKNGYHLECRSKDKKYPRKVELIKKEVFEDFKAEVKSAIKNLNRKFKELKKSLTPNATPRQSEKEESETMLEERRNSSSPRENCAGVPYEGKCFLLLEENVMYGRGHFGEACVNRSGHLANVYSEQHYERLASYLRSKIDKESGHIVAHLGMKYDFQNRRPMFYDGSVADFDGPWVPGYPKNAEGQDGMLMYLDLDPKEEFQGLFNFWSKNPHSYGLCEIEV